MTHRQEGTVATKPAASVSIEGLLNLLVVYVVWGSTYLAIRVAVQEGSGFPPFIMAAARTFLGGLLLLLWAKWKGESIKISRHDALLLAITGVMLWCGGNGLVTWSEHRMQSGLAALLVACTPFWVAALESIVDRRMPSVLLVTSMLVGFCGTGFLSYPVLAAGIHADNVSVIALLCASLSWGGGSFLQRRKGIHLGARVTAGYQQIFALPGFLMLSFLMHEPQPHPVSSSWIAFVYLVIFGSVIAITSFTRALQILPTKVLFTYSYINPMIALLLGWLVLKEPITRWTLIGASLIIAGVVGVFRETQNARRSIN